MQGSVLTSPSILAFWDYFYFHREKRKKGMSVSRDFCLVEKSERTSRAHGR